MPDVITEPHRTNPVRGLVVDDVEPDSPPGSPARCGTFPAGELGLDAAVLNRMLLVANGLTSLRDLDCLNSLHDLCDGLPAVCVLCLTARDAVEDRIVCIAAGAVDYATEPFSLTDLATHLPTTTGSLTAASAGPRPGEASPATAIPPAPPPAAAPGPG